MDLHTHTSDRPVYMTHGRRHLLPAGGRGAHHAAGRDRAERLQLPHGTAPGSVFGWLESNRPGSIGIVLIFDLFFLNCTYGGRQQHAAFDPARSGAEWWVQVLNEDDDIGTCV